MYPLLIPRSVSPYSITLIYTSRSPPSCWCCWLAAWWLCSNRCFLPLLKNFTFCWPCIMWWFLVNDQRDAQILLNVFICIYNSLHVSSTSCLSSGEANCINTASGNSHSMLVAEMCAVFQPAHISATNIEWQLPEAVLIQFSSPDDEHDVLETRREL